MAEDSSNAFASALARARQVDFYASFFKSTFRYVIYVCVSYVFKCALFARNLSDVSGRRALEKFPGGRRKAHVANAYFLNFVPSLPIDLYICVNLFLCLLILIR